MYSLSRHHGAGRVRLAAVLLAAGLAATGCSGDSDDSDKTDDPTGPDLSAEPTNVTWSTVGNSGEVKVPTADEGPESVGTYGEATGFDQSPVGAGLAAVNGPLRVSFAPDTQWEHAVEASIAPGESRDELLTNRAALETTGEVDDEFVPAIAGWRVTDYTDQDATVEVFSSYSDESLSRTTYELVWLDGDWKIQLPGDVASVDELPDDLVEVAE